MKAGKLYLITWLDHVTFELNSWRSEEDLDDLQPLEVITIGWLMKEEKDHIIVAGTIGSHGNLQVNFLF